MTTRTLGDSDLVVSEIGLGGNNFGRSGTPTETIDGTRAVIDAAQEVGITLIDTAEMYGREFGLSERLLGEAIRGRRDDFVIASKFGNLDFPSPIAELGPPGSRAYIRTAIDGSLSRLDIETIDLYQQHTPDPATPIDETLLALDELVTEGKIRAFGHSNFTATQLLEARDAAARLGTRPFVSAQNEYNLLKRGVEDELLPAAVSAGVGFLPWFPLANGLFTGKFSRTVRPADSRIARQRPHIADDAPWDAIEALEAFGAERGLSLLELTFGWLLTTPALDSVIAGATRPEQVRQNAAAGVRWRPDDAERAVIDALFPAS